jgi:hypothetical protein
VGSENFSSTSLDLNRDLGIVVDSSAIDGQLATMVEGDITSASGGDPGRMCEPDAHPLGLETTKPDQGADITGGQGRSPAQHAPRHRHLLAGESSPQTGAQGNGGAREPRVGRPRPSFLPAASNSTSSRIREVTLTR